MQVRVLTEKDRKAWDAFVASQNNPQILQSYEWGRFKAKLGWEHFIMVVEGAAGIEAGISVLARKLPFIGKTLFYAPRGPIASRPEHIDALVDGLCVEAAAKNAVAIKIDPEIELSDPVVKRLIERGFIRKKKQVQPRSTYLLDLFRGTEDLLKSFEEKTRYNIRLAEKKGVKVFEDSTITGIDAFYKMYIETSKRDTFLIHPKSYYLRLKEQLMDKSMANVFIASFRGIPVASVFIFRMGSRVWYMYGASVNEYRNVMPNHALHWHVIKWAKEKGYRTYDLWGIPANPNEKHPLYGVYRFKKGFNGELKTWIGAYDLPFDKIGYMIFDKGIALYQSLRSLLTKGRISDSLSE